MIGWIVVVAIVAFFIAPGLLVAALEVLPLIIVMFVAWFIYSMITGEKQDDE